MLLEAVVRSSRQHQTGLCVHLPPRNLSFQAWYYHQIPDVCRVCRSHAGVLYELTIERFGVERRIVRIELPCR